jgi:hypothetical protein
MSKFNSLHRQLRMAINCQMVLFFSDTTQKYWALPINVGTKFNFTLIKSFE